MSAADADAFTFLFVFMWRIVQAGLAIGVIAVGLTVFYTIRDWRARR